MSTCQDTLNNVDTNVNSVLTTVSLLQNTDLSGVDTALSDIKNNLPTTITYFTDLGDNLTNIKDNLPDSIDYFTDNQTDIGNILNAIGGYNTPDSGLKNIRDSVDEILNVKIQLDKTVTTSFAYDLIQRVNDSVSYSSNASQYASSALQEVQSLNIPDAVDLSGLNNKVDSLQSDITKIINFLGLQQ